MRQIMLAAIAIVLLASSAYAQCVNPKAKHCMCSQSSDPRASIGYNPVIAGGDSVRAPWTCVDMDTNEVSYHDARAYVTQDPSLGVKLQSPGGSSYSSDFRPPEQQ